MRWSFIRNYEILPMEDLLLLLFLLTLQPNPDNAVQRVSSLGVPSSDKQTFILQSAIDVPEESFLF